MKDIKCGYPIPDRERSLPWTGLIGGEIGKRLAEMGFTQGATGHFIRGAFLRGPLQIRIRGYDLLIRRCEAKLIEVSI